VLLAWGTTEGKGNTIGRGSLPLEKATVKLADQRISSQQNWVVVDGLRPNTEYSYEVTLGSQRIGGGTVRTCPEKPEKLAFLCSVTTARARPCKRKLRLKTIDHG